MTNEEAKDLFMRRVPVQRNGIIYKRISAIIYRLDDKNNVYVCLELLDKCGHCVMIAQAKDVSACGE